MYLADHSTQGVELLLTLSWSGNKSRCPTTYVIDGFGRVWRCCCNTLLLILAFNADKVHVDAEIMWVGPDPERLRTTQKKQT